MAVTREKGEAPAAERGAIALRERLPDSGEVENPADVISRLPVRRNAVEFLDGSLASVIRGQGELDTPSVDERFQVLYAGGNVGFRIVRIPDLVLSSRRGHQLH